MPSPFDVTVATNTVTLNNEREAVVPFTVKNNTRRRVHAIARVTTVPEDGAQWLSFVPPEGGSAENANVRDFAIDSTQQFQVRIAVPMTAPPARYTLRLIVADEVNPDENFTQSPDVTFTVPEIPKPEPRTLPSWLIPAIIAAVVLIVVIIAVAVISSNNARNADATATAVAQDQARQTADAATASAQTATQAAIGATATQAAFATATQQALSVYVGNWEPLSSSPTPLLALNIAAAGGSTLTVSYTSPCSIGNRICIINTNITRAISGVAFNPNQLAVGDGIVQMLIAPGNDNRLLVNVGIGNNTTLQTFQRRQRGTIDLGEVTINRNQLDNARLDQLRDFVVPTNP